MLSRKERREARRAQIVPKRLSSSINAPVITPAPNKKKSKGGSGDGNSTVEFDDKSPHSFVINRGKVGKYVQRLTRDLRRVMEPNTATNLKVSKRNNIRDFVVNASPLGVTHLIVLTRSDSSVTLRIIRLPHGPTLTFRVKEYTLARDVVSSLRHPVFFQKQFSVHPLVIMNNFAVDRSKKQLQLMQTMLQNMFATVHVDTVNLSTIRRCVMLDYVAESDTVEFRHYAIKTIPARLSKSTKKLVQSKVPNLGKYRDISDFYLNPGQLSESEHEADEKDVVLPQDLSARGCTRGRKCNVRLVELGPRMSLELLKIEEGIDEGEVLYHSYIKKSTSEILKLRKELPMKKKLKERIRKNAEHRVIRRLKMAADQRKQIDEPTTNYDDTIVE